jgi:hypothetical protein
MQLPSRETVSLKTLQTDIQNAIDKAFNPHPTNYKKVICQFFRFCNDDIDGAADLLKELGNFVRTSYGFDVRYSVIGDHETLNPAMEMAGILNDLGKECGTQGSLIIVYYSGHGRVSTAPNGREKRLEVAYVVPGFHTLTAAD